MAISENGFEVVLEPEGALRFRDKLATGPALHTWDADPGDLSALLAVVAEARLLIDDYHTLLPFISECLGCNESVATALGVSLDKLAIDLGYAESAAVATDEVVG